MVINQKYAKILYPLGALAIVWWAITSVLKEIESQSLSDNLLPLSVQLLFCLLILILVVMESIKLWTKTDDKKSVRNV